MYYIDAEPLIKEYGREYIETGTEDSTTLEELIYGLNELDPVHAAGTCYCKECGIGEAGTNNCYVYQIFKESRIAEKYMFCGVGRLMNIPKDGV